jgi:hypothetical protein
MPGLNELPASGLAERTEVETELMAPEGRAEPPSRTPGAVRLSDVWIRSTI